MSATESGPWTKILETTVEDSRQQTDPLPLQTFPLAKSASAQFVKFDLLEFYGFGGGLQYLSVPRYL